MRRAVQSGETRAAIFLLGAITVIAAHAQTFTTLVNLNGANGARPGAGSLVQGVDGSFYGTTSAGGASKYGTIFRIAPQGQLKTLYSFAGVAGASGLIVEPNGMLYGTTHEGGANGLGVIFQITPSGALTTLHSFDGADGAEPTAGLVMAFNRMLYGTTSEGGATSGGGIFRITPGGTLTALHGFSGAPFGSGFVASLVQASNGMLYGTTSIGGVYGMGSVYAIGLNGAFATLYSFNGFNGQWPYAELVQGNDGNLYGTTSYGGTNGPFGIIFQITSAGTLTTLHNFNFTDGSYPSSALVQGADGNFYGTAAQGGANCGPIGCGTIFRVTPTGTLTTLHNFDETDGSNPYAGLVQGTDGNFYGTTEFGGANKIGTVFRLSVGLGPFVKLLPAFGAAGAAVTILGTDLTGAARVTFDGKAAAFTVLSPTAIRTTVPPGTSTGTVRVVTPGGPLASNVAFQVLGTIGH
jgi:uncharacterized repeat protein (TIGR03803 family)